MQRSSAPAACTPLRWPAAAGLLLALAAMSAPSHAQGEKLRHVGQAKAGKAARTTPPPATLRDGLAETRLVEVYRLTGEGRTREALAKAESLARDYPNFQLAQLALGDLLAARVRPLRQMGDVPASVPAAGDAAPPRAAGDVLGELRAESRQRTDALRARPPAGSIPAQFLEIAPRTRHAIAVDASRSRLYLFENTGKGMELIADYYASVGKLGIEKALEGDQRTPLGIYFVGRHIPGPRLPEFYGKGALTVNFPNDWDKAVGRSGSGIWLHGSPPDQFSRAPEASDGCLVLANPDLTLLMQTVDRQTPVLIREKLQWVAPKAQAQQKAADAFVRVVEEWKSAWDGADPRKLAALYAPDLLQSPASRASQERLAAYLNRPGVTLQDLSIYSWKDAKGEIRVVNLRASSKAFAEGLPLRQYWRKTGGRWQLFSEDVMG